MNDLIKLLEETEIFNLELGNEELAIFEFDAFLEGNEDLETYADAKPGMHDIHEITIIDGDSGRELETGSKLMLLVDLSGVVSISIDGSRESNPKSYAAFLKLGKLAEEGTLEDEIGFE